MYRKPRYRDRSGELDLDSLMDILSCLVGVMLFLVIYTVLELGSAAYEARVPVVRAIPSGSDPVVVLAEGGTIRAVDVRGPLNRLLSGAEIVPARDVPIFVEQANARPVSDDWFDYSLAFDERFVQFGDPLGTLSLEIVERPDVVGDSLHQLNRASRYGALLAALDPDDNWLYFEVDSASVVEFRRARDMAIADGFTVQWTPREIDFPFTHRIAGGSEMDLLRSKGDQSDAND